MYTKGHLLQKGPPGLRNPRTLETEHHGNRGPRKPKMTEAEDHSSRDDFHINFSAEFEFQVTPKSIFKFSSRLESQFGLIFGIRCSERIAFILLQNCKFD